MLYCKASNSHYDKSCEELQEAHSKTLRLGCSLALLARDLVFYLTATRGKTLVSATGIRIGKNKMPNVTQAVCDVAGAIVTSPRELQP
jgi:hypothetical protein